MVKDNISDEEREWIAHEEGYVEGYRDGTHDFVAVARIVAEMRRRGLPVINIVKLFGGGNREG